MKFLLTAVNAKYIHSNPAVYSLKAYAGKEYENEIEIAEYTINHQTEAVLADIYERKPDIIGFSCYIWNWKMIRELTEELSKIMPKLPIWLGGPEASFEAERTMKLLLQVKGIMVGEGEETFRRLLQFYLRDGQSDCRMQDIAGIVYRDGGSIIRTPERELLDMNSLPFLYSDAEAFENRIIYYESSRGCPFHCSYCLSSIDRKVRLKNTETVKRELRFFLNHRVPQVKFIDRTFNCSHEHAMSIWKYIAEHDNGVTNFHFEIAADLLNEEELTILSQMRPGLVQLEIGVQSANDRTLKEIHRVTDMDRLRATVERIHSGGNVHVHLDLIAGLPYEDYESFGKSFDTVYAMCPEQLQLGFLKVLKGSPMHENADEYGISYTSQPPYEVLYSKWLPFADVCRLKRVEEMVELYYNSNQFTHTLRQLVKAFAGPFAMFEKLADYYKEKGYFINSPSRVYRYEVLFAFACEWEGGREELYRELLTYDIYLRENMKSRPGFAKDISGECYKEELREFYKKEEYVRGLLPDYGEYQIRQIARMTHIEWFDYPVWELAEDARCAGGEKAQRYKKMEKPTMLLFDYQKRNPLTHEAVTWRLV